MIRYYWIKGKFKFVNGLLELLLIIFKEDLSINLIVKRVNIFGLDELLCELIDCYNKSVKKEYRVESLDNLIRYIESLK